jgi:hypothetical protein
MVKWVLILTISMMLSSKGNNFHNMLSSIRINWKPFFSKINIWGFCFMGCFDALYNNKSLQKIISNHSMFGLFILVCYGLCNFNLYGCHFDYLCDLFSWFYFVLLLWIKRYHVISCYIKLYLNLMSSDLYNFN